MASLPLSLAGAGTPALAATRHATHIVATATATTVKVGAAVAVTGSAKPAVAGLTVTLQRFDGHHWRAVSHGKESRTGAYTLAGKAPSKAGTLLLRVVRAAAKSDKAGVSRTLPIHIVKTAYAVTSVAGASVASGAPITVTGTVKPASGSTVQLQRQIGTSWKTLATATLARTSTYRFSTTQASGTYKLRVIKPQTTKVAGGISKAFTVVVAAPVAPPTAPPVAAPVISTTALPAGVTHHAYAATLAATGGSGALTWSLTAGSLPIGLTLSAAGVLSGTPLVGGAIPLTLTVTDGGARTAAKTLSLSISLATGTLAAWGYNGDGELADSIPQSFTTASPVAGLSAVTKIAAGGETGYALVAGGVLSYGVGRHGELGNGAYLYSATPVPVSGLSSGVTAISAGSNSAYALKSNGTVWAWGTGGSGELGNGSFSDSNLPVQVTGLTGITAIAGGRQADGYALKSDGTVWAWGDNFEGQLGDGTTNSSDVPVLVTGLTGQAVIAIATGGTTGYAVMADHTVRAWGYNGDGEIGDGTTTDRPSAVVVTGLTTVTAVTATSNDAYALRTAGTVFTWGLSTSASPAQVAGLTTVTSIAASDQTTYALLADHTVRSWGDNSYGQLGNGTTSSTSVPVTVNGLSSVAAIAGGGSIGYALKTDGTVWSWGFNTLAMTDHASPTPIALTQVTTISADSYGGLAVRADGTAWDWGANWAGQLGNGSNDPFPSDVPVQVSGLTGVLAVAGGSSARYAVKSDGTVWAWGDNSVNQFGVSALGSSNVPVQVAGLSGVTAITAGSGGSEYVLKSDGTVWAWGGNARGELGNNTVIDSAAPVQVLGLTHITALAAGYETGYAVGAGGAVWSWGANDSGQLGNGTATETHVPLPVSGLSAATGVAAGYTSAYALKSDGSVVAWGANGIGELGDGSTLGSRAPVVIPGLSGIIAISAGNSDGYALKADGSVWAWGWNANGQLGVGTADTTLRPGPVAVSGLSGVIGIAANADSTFALRAG